MNKRIIFLLSLVLLSAMPLFAYDPTLEAIKNLDVEKALLFADSSLKISVQEKEKYSKAVKGIIDDTEIQLLSNRFSRPDLIRLASGLGLLALTTVTATIFFKTLPELRKMFANKEIPQALSKAAQKTENPLGDILLGIPVPGLATIFGVTMGSLEVYKGLTQYDRKQALNKAHAIAALINRAKTTEPVRKIDKHLFEEEITL